MGDSALIGVSVGLGGLCALLVVLKLLRYIRQRRREYAYQRVDHMLDSEEMTFKAQLEHDDIDALFMEGADSADLAFDDADLADIEMLDNYRKTLQSSDPDDIA
mmetsp:Transcript_29765/g.95234  ORF Transcript_29765/g.95234 Transcript_29765/m.95234 type:complete len:104 (-) Transcript_29765:554-865(-)